MPHKKEALNYSNFERVFIMNPIKTVDCPYCVDGKCYANAAVSPEEYDSYQPQCCGCRNHDKSAKK
jgi:hypothetical protein